MTPAELRAAMRELGLTAAALADLCGVNNTTVFCWRRAPGAPGALPVPRYAETILRLLRERCTGADAVVHGLVPDEAEDEEPPGYSPDWEAPPSA